MTKKLNKIEELIAELCPDGVEFKELGEVLDYEQPTKYIVSKAKYNDENNMPVLTAGKSFILGYTDEKDGIYKANTNNAVVIFDDFTTAFHWVDFEFKVKSSAMKMIRPKQDAKINFRFVYYAMRCIGYQSQDHARHWISKYSKFKIPIPPLKIQEEIVDILDKFTQLEAELEAELEARKKQYQHYRDEMLSFEGDEVEWKTLGGIGDVAMCKRIFKNQTSSSGDIPFFTIGTFGQQAKSFIPEEIYDEYKAKYSFPKNGDVLISASGTIGRLVIYDGNPAYFQDSNIIWLKNDETKVLNKFLYYIYTITKWETEGGTIKRLYNRNFKKIKIPIPYKNGKPDLEKQKEIVATLDKFDKLVNDISIGLPAEIKARRQQYEYYRGKLLTFKELEK